MDTIFTTDQTKLLESVAMAFTTVGDNGVPNTIAVACVKVIEPNKLLITDNFMNKTRINLLKNRKVAIAVWSKDEEEGYQIKGEAEYLTEGEYKDMVDKMEDNQGLAHKAAIVVTVQEIWDLAKPKLLFNNFG